MSDSTFPLSLLPIGKKAAVFDLKNEAAMKRRLLDLGFTRGTIVEALQKSPSGDPIAYLVRGAVIALRCEDSSAVLLNW